MKLGLVLPASEPTPEGPRPLPFERICAIAERAESLGFHSLWWFDHYFIEGGQGRRSGSFECWTLLSAVAARTQRALLGSLVLCNSFRHAAILAKQAASLQEISDGRAILGLGAGWHEPEYKALGLPFDHRVGRLEESMRAIRELFDSGTSSFQGRWLQLEDAELFPKPRTKVPLLIAAAGARIMRLTAECADGWNLAWYGADAGRFLAKQAELREAIRAAGRSPAEVMTSAGVNVMPLARAGDEQAMLDRLRSQSPQLASASNAEIKQRYILGDAQSITEQFRAYSAAGTDLAICLVPGLTDSGAGRELLERLGNDVLPRC